MRIPRTIAVAVTCLTLAAACTEAGDLAEEIDRAASEAAERAGEAVEDAADAIDGDDGDGPTAGDPGGGDGQDAGGDGADAGDPDGGGSDPDPGGDAAPQRSTGVDDFGGVGANGRAMLRGEYPRLVIEIDAQEGAGPDAAAVDHLASTIRRYVDKPAGVTVQPVETFASPREQWTSQDLRAAAAQHRDTASSADTVSVYVLYVRGGFYADGQETNAIGVAYNASEMGVFPQRWRSGLDLTGSTQAVERAVLVHEWGHLLGLVNITYRSNIGHEDPEHPKHSNNRGSVMHWAVETTLIGQVFNGPPPSDFDDADRADIEGLRSGEH